MIDEENEIKEDINQPSNQAPYQDSYKEPPVQTSKKTDPILIMKNDPVLIIVAICCIGAAVLFIGALLPDGSSDIGNNAVAQVYTLEGFTSNHTFKTPNEYFVGVTPNTTSYLSYSFMDSENDRHFEISFYDEKDIDELVDDARNITDSEGSTIHLNGYIVYYKFKTSDYNYWYITSFDGESTIINIPGNIPNPDDFVERFLAANEDSGKEVSMGDTNKAINIAINAFADDFNIDKSVLYNGLNDITNEEISDYTYVVTIEYKGTSSDIGILQPYTVNISDGSATMGKNG